jgi:hypothetical protein
LLNYIKWVAEGHIPIGRETVSFLVVDTDIDPTTTQLGLVRKIEIGLRRELGKSERARNYLTETWSFLKRFEAAGVRLNPEAPDLDEATSEEFSHSLAATALRICDRQNDSLLSARYDGVLLLIDEADNGSRDLHLGSFLKLLLERLQRRGCEHVIVGLAGLPGLRDVLIRSHPSSLRLFDEMPLERLKDEEVGRVIDICLTRSSEDSGVPTSIRASAREALIRLSEGYPHFIQQFGYCAFAADTDNTIDLEDVQKSAFGERGAMELIGDRYYRDDFYNKIQNDSYRQVLRIMAEELDGWVTKEKIRRGFKGTGTVLTNAIKALRERHIILSKQGERGVYRLQHKGFALWIKLYTSDAATLHFGSG